MQIEKLKNKHNSIDQIAQHLKQRIETLAGRWSVRSHHARAHLKQRIETSAAMFWPNWAISERASQTEN